MSPTDLDVYESFRSILTPGQIRKGTNINCPAYLSGLLAEAEAVVPAKKVYEWYESLAETGPGQGDPLFDWLADSATLDDMAWFIRQESAGEAGFGDLVALTMVGMPDDRVKLELARNLWDEMGNGRADLMHDKLLRAVGEYLAETCPTVLPTILPQPLRLANLMAGLALFRCHAYRSLGCLGVVEMTAPGRVSKVTRGLERLGVPAEVRRYFDLHATLDVKHSREWNREVIARLPQERLREAAVGAYARLQHGAECFRVYRAQLGVGRPEFQI